jgi:YidC/Oxa1 family membrane protein insertase
MEKRLALAIALCIGFLIVWSWLFPPAPTAPPPGPGAPESAAAPGAPGAAAPDQREAATASAPGATATPAGVGPAPAPTAEAVAAAAEEEIALDLPHATVRLTNRGARVRSWTLKDYRDHLGRPLDLVSKDAAKLDRLPLDLLVEDATVAERLRTGLYRVEREESGEGDGRTTTLRFTWSDGSGTGATKIVRAKGAAGLVEIEAAATANGRPLEPAIAWGAGFEEDRGEVSETMGVGIRALRSRGGTVERRFQSKIKAGEPWIEEGPLDFAGVESKYFAAIFVPPPGAPTGTKTEIVRLVEEGREHLHLAVSIRPPAGATVRLFAGPKSWEVLQAADHGLDRVLDFGFFGFIAHPLFAALKFLHKYIGNWGWSIVLLTVAIRLLFFPFLHRSQLKMRQMQEKMKRIQPKMKSLKERFHRLEKKEAEKGGAGARARVRQQQNEEMMKLYQEEGINPLSSVSGCLPLMAQMPILAAFYTILSISIELRQAPWILWVHDLSQKDIALVILMSASMLAQQLMTASAIPDPAQRRMMYLMPLIFTIFFVNMPSGLVLYWLVNNLLGIVQQYLVNKEADAQVRAAAAA